MKAGLSSERSIGGSAIELSEAGLVEPFVVCNALEGMQRQLATVNATYHELSELEILVDPLGSKEVVLSENGYYQLTGDNDFQTAQALFFPRLREARASASR